MEFLCSLAFAVGCSKVVVMSHSSNCNGCNCISSTTSFISCLTCVELIRRCKLLHDISLQKKKLLNDMLIVNNKFSIYIIHVLVFFYVKTECCRINLSLYLKIKFELNVKYDFY